MYQLPQRPDHTTSMSIVGPSKSLGGLSGAGPPPGSSASRGVSPAPASTPGTGRTGTRLRADAPGVGAAGDREDEDGPERHPGLHGRAEQGRDDQAGHDDDAVQLVSCSHGLSSRDGPGCPGRE